MTVLTWLTVQGAGSYEALDNSLCLYASWHGYYIDAGGTLDELCFQQNIGYPSLITSIFIHGDWFHLILNIWFLWIFGNNIEEAFGPLKFLIFYLFAGVLTEIASIMASTDPYVLSFGASGATAAVLSAYAVIFKHAKILIFFPLYFRFWPKKRADKEKNNLSSWLSYTPAIYLFLIFLGFDLVTFFEDLYGENSGVNVMAHLSGYFLGGLVGFIALKSGTLAHLKQTIQHQNSTKADEQEINPTIARFVGGVQIIASWGIVAIALAFILFIAVQIL